MDISFEVWFILWVQAILAIAVLTLALASRKARKSQQPFLKAFTELKYIVLLATLVAVTALGYQWLFQTQPKIMQVNGLVQKGNQLVWQDMTKPIEVIYSHPLNTKDIKIDMTADSEGEWQYTPNFPGSAFITKLVYTPKVTATPDRKADLYISGHRGLMMQGEVSDDNVDFSTAKFEDATESPLQQAEENNSVAVSERLVFEFPGSQETFARYSFEFEPKLAGVAQWSGSSLTQAQLEFLPAENINAQTKYSVNVYRESIKTDLESGEVVSATGINGWKSFTWQPEKDIAAKTDSPTVVSFTPRISEGDVAITADIFIEFAGEIENADEIKQSFMLEPAAQGVLYWRDNSLIYDTSEDFRHSTSYKVSFVDTAGEKRSWRFTTSRDKFVLNVPLISQVLRFECNVAAARMLLAYQGINMSFDDFFAKLPKQNVPYNAARNTWGNPNLGYVGDVTGKNKGYGVYWEPIAQTVEQISGKNVEIRRNWNLEDMLGVVESGSPVQIWWQNARSTPTDMTWRTPDGQEIKAINGMHSEVVVGWVGAKSNPDAIIVNDPWRGHREVKTADFLGLWALFDNTGIYIER